MGATPCPPPPGSAAHAHAYHSPTPRRESALACLHLVEAALLHEHAGLVLLLARLDDLAEEVHGQRGGRRAVRGALHRSHRLGDLAGRKALAQLGGPEQVRVGEALRLDGVHLHLAARHGVLEPVPQPVAALRSRAALVRPRGQDVLLQVQVKQALALQDARDRKLHHLVHAVQDGGVEVAGPVGGQDHHKVARLVARSVQHRVEGAAQALAHALVPPAQERVGLVNEEQQAGWGGLRPVKDLVQLGDRPAAQGRHVAAGEDGVVEARGSCEALGGERLAGAGGAVEEHVAEGGAVRLGVGGAGGQVSDVVLQLGRQHHVGKAPRGVHPLGRPAQQRPRLGARRLPDQLGRAEVGRGGLAGDDGAFARRKVAQRQRGAAQN
mmetsp:Transcript_36124/g.93828  ORF Transcript_36124/g.93828 Transcript_36124/m.93828 type:complete len:381 (+) Transcript_36124:171-1313(+)